MCYIKDPVNSETPGVQVRHQVSTAVPSRPELSPGVPDGSFLVKNDVYSLENHQGHLGHYRDGWGPLWTPGVTPGPLALHYLPDSRLVLVSDPYLITTD